MTAYLPGGRVTLPNPLMALLERETTLAQLQGQWREACVTGQGRLVFIEGEAGIGKTSLLRAFVQELGRDARVYWGACDGVVTPLPLGALEDIAAQAGGLLARRLADGSERHAQFAAFVDLLAQRPAVAVLEDLHWADQATLDLLRHVGRRIGRTPSLLIGSFRSDELVPGHPLRAVLGDLASGGPLRLALPPLSPAAVGQLCAGHRVDCKRLHRESGGNPFFVTEVLAGGGAGVEVPATVADAVLARAGRLSPSARAVLDAAAVAGPRVEPWLLQQLTAAESTAIDECLATGTLRAEAGVYVFRHELARQAVLHAMTPTRAMSLHRLVLPALLANAATRDAAARLALHAEGARDAEAVRQWAVRAAHEAAARGAHRQAADHWARALSYAASDAERAGILDAYAVEIHMSVSIEEAITLRRQAARLWRQAGQADRSALSLAELVLLLCLAGRRAQAQEAFDDAGRLTLEPASLAALELEGCAAWLRLHDGDDDGAIALARPVLAAAERLGDAKALLDILMTIGSAEVASGRVDEGIRHLERALELAIESRDDRRAGQIHANLGATCLAALQLPRAEDVLRRGIAFCAERDLDTPRLHQLASWSTLCRYLGRWDEAEKAAADAIADPRVTTVARVAGLAALGRLRARRGDAAAWEALDKASEVARDAGPMSVALVARARAEAAWLDGRPTLAAQEAEQGLALLQGGRRAEARAELLLWRRLGGASDPLPDDLRTHPFALEAAGHWQEAAQAWRDLGCRYETARALAAGDEAAQREALALCESLGALALAERVRHRLRAAGARGLPRGRRSSTQQHPAGLTSKEVAVLALLAVGLRNKEIAERLHRSPRTIDHHIQAIFAKLGVTSRSEAVGAALRGGLLPDRQGTS